jgi:hypothetical protein
MVPEALSVQAARRFFGVDEAGRPVPPGPGSTYSRFSLELVRRPASAPYTGEEVMSRPAAAVQFLHRLLARVADDRR